MEKNKEKKEYEILKELNNKLRKFSDDEQKNTKPKEHDDEGR